MNKIVLTGNIARDAELRFTPDGTPVSNFAIGVREFRKKDDKEALFIDLVIWGKRAEALNPYLKKGKSILVEGRLDITKRLAENGKTYTNVRVYVGDLEFLGKKESATGVQVTEQSEGGKDGSTESLDEVPF